MKQKKKYVAPELTVVQFHAEHGYAASGDFTFSGTAQYIDAAVNAELARLNAEDGDVGNEFAAGYFDNVDETNPTGSWVYTGNGAGGTWF